MRVERISIPSIDFAQKLYTSLAPHIPEFPYPISVKRSAGATARTAHSCNSNIRLYKYGVGQHFGPHYDDSVRDAETGAKSEWTLLIYLTGAQDGVEGGEVCVPLHPSVPTLHDSTDHLLPRSTRKVSGKSCTPVDSRTGAAPPVRGILFKEGRTRLTYPCSHGQNCLLHEGSPVTKGNKYVLRSDLMFIK